MTPQIARSEQRSIIKLNESEIEHLKLTIKVLEEQKSELVEDLIELLIDTQTKKQKISLLEKEDEELCERHELHDK